MDEDIFSSNGESLEEVVLLMLGMRGLTVAAAESCTGGMLAARLTSVPGSSRYFLGGAVVYSDALKTIFADVPGDVIANDGPVSEPTTRALAEGIRRRTGASIGIGITGIAGPHAKHGSGRGKADRPGLYRAGVGGGDAGEATEPARRPRPHPHLRHAERARPDSPRAALKVNTESSSSLR